jgi:hypothetical protein
MGIGLCRDDFIILALGEVLLDRVLDIFAVADTLLWLFMRTCLDADIDVAVHACDWGDGGGKRGGEGGIGRGGFGGRWGMRDKANFVSTS